MKVWKDGKKVEYSYDDVCSELGFIPEVRFVKITNAGTITFTCGKPNEIRALLSAVTETGFRAAASLRNAL